MLTDVVRAISISNMLFLPVWFDLIGYRYLSRGRWFYIALLLNLAVFTGILVVVTRVVRSARSRSVTAAGNFALALLFVAPFGWLRVKGTLIPELLSRPALAAIALLGVLLLWRAVRQERFNRVLTQIVFAFAFCAVVTLPRVIAPIFTVQPDRIERPVAPLFTPRRPRVLWMVFDELDQQTALADRAADVSLPELDRLRSQAIYGTNASPPAGETLLSMPSLITGRIVRAAYPKDSNDLWLFYEGSSEEVPWSTQPNVFQQVKARKLDTALVGWYHPYCRVLRDVLDICSWESIGPDRSLGEALRGQLGRLTDPLLRRVPNFGVPLSGSEQVTQDTPRHRGRYARTLTEAEQVLRDTDVSLLFVHWPVPHFPVIFDRTTGQFRAVRGGTYDDNLALVDKTIGEIRRTLESINAWEETTVMVTADHWWRLAPHIDRRVPFLLKLPRQREQITYAAPFNTVLLAGLALSVIDGAVTTPADAVAWLDRRGAGQVRDSQLPALGRTLP